MWTYSIIYDCRGNLFVWICNYFSVQVFGFLSSLIPRHKSNGLYVSVWTPDRRWFSGEISIYTNNISILNCVYDILKNHDRMIRFTWLMLVLLQSGERDTHQLVLRHTWSWYISGMIKISSSIRRTRRTTLLTAFHW